MSKYAITLLTLFLFAGFSISAQVEFGVVTGPTYTSIQSEVFDNIPNRFEFDVPAGLGVTAGAFVRLPLDEENTAGVTFSARYHTLSNDARTSELANNTLITNETYFSHKEEFLILSITGELRVINADKPLFFLVGFAAHRLLTYRESRQLITRVDGSNSVSVVSSDRDYDGVTMPGFQAGLKWAFGDASITAQASLTGHRWDNEQQVRIVRLSLLAGYSF